MVCVFATVCALLDLELLREPPSPLLLLECPFPFELFPVSSEGYLSPPFTVSFGESHHPRLENHPLAQQKQRH